MANKPSARPSGHAAAGDAPDQEPKRLLALLFPGQGSQHTGMGKHIAEISEAARQIFAQADEALGYRLSNVCFEGSEDELQDQVNAQPALLATSLAHLGHLRERLQEKGRNLAPSFLAGHSLGQYTAAVAADSLDLSDGLRLVRERGRIMKEWARRRPGGLATILGLSDADVTQVCADASPEGEVDVAVRNAPGQTVIAGETGALQRAVELARERGARALNLQISVPSHIPMMRDAGRELSRFISTLPFREPKTPLVSNLSAKLLTNAEDVRQELSEQICSAIEWVRCVAAMAGEGTEAFVEVGPGHTLSKIVRRIRDDANVFAADDAAADTIESLAATVPLSVPKFVVRPKRAVRARRKGPGAPPREAKTAR